MIPKLYLYVIKIRSRSFPREKIFFEVENVSFKNPAQDVYFK